MKTEIERIRTAAYVDADNPLGRQPGETSRANQALRDYYAQGPTRSLRKLLANYREQIAANPASQPPTRRLQTLTSWSMDLAWQLRVEAQEELDRKAEAAARQQAIEEQARLWAERRQALREADWNDAESLRKLTRAILADAPKYIKTTRRVVKGEGGNPDREIITVGIDVNLAVRAAEVGSKMQRLAADMETDHQLVEEIEPGEDIETIRQRRYDKSIQDLNNPALTGEEPE